MFTFLKGKMYQGRPVGTKVFSSEVHLILGVNRDFNVIRLAQNITLYIHSAIDGQLNIMNNEQFGD